MAAGNLFRQYFGKVYLQRSAGQFISESHCLAQCTGGRIGAQVAPQIRFQILGMAAERREGRVQLGNTAAPA
jgi:hypothetical protein